jgi:undecaprenyl-diphosphatase
VLGALFHDLIKERLFNPMVVSVALIVGGIALLLIERLKPRPHLHDLDTLPLQTCFMIGVFQCLSMVPGTSRSGATILGAMVLGVDRKTAAEYSFFLAIPTMFAATSYELYQARHELTSDGAMTLALGFAAAFVSALFVVRGLITYCSKHGFAPFGWYRIALGIAMLATLSQW